MYLVVGSAGQLGTEIKEILKDKGFYTTVDTLDITDRIAVEKFFEENKNRFKAIINCSGYTAVDGAEDNIEEATNVNVVGVKNLAKSGLPLIHISTDYVFDGLKNTPYNEEDETNPLSIYGKTKLAGEEEALEYCETCVIIRTAWLYSSYGKNFVKTMLKLGTEKEELKVVFDQVGTPTYAKDLAEVIVKILENLKENTKEIYNFSNEGVCSWYDFATSIMELASLKCNVLPIESKDYPTKAVRPTFSVLNKSKIKKDFNIKINHWRISLKECIEEIKKQQEQ